MEWLLRPLVADGVEAAGPLDPALLTDADLRSVCARMHAILETIEMPRCEGRLIPAPLFDAIDTLECRLRHPAPRLPRLAEWAETIREFGAYYGLGGTGPIVVEAPYWRAAVARSGAEAEARRG